MKGKKIMTMYCKKCGAEIGEGLRVCLSCGEEVEYSSQQLREEFSDGIVDEGYYDSDSARRVEFENSVEIKRDVKKHMWGTVLITLLIAVAVLGIAIAAMAVTKTGIFAESDIDDLISAQNPSSQTQEIVTPVGGADDSGVQASVEQGGAGAEEPPAEQTPTAEELKAAEAENIRALLLSKKWSTTIEGYEGDVEFKDGGKAVITAKIPVLGMTVKKSIDAKYSFTDDCMLTLTAEFGGNNYGIKGVVVRNSDSELEVVRANNAGSIKLTASK